jgi:hypothetical protein
MYLGWATSRQTPSCLPIPNLRQRVLQLSHLQTNLPRMSSIQT